MLNKYSDRNNNFRAVGGGIYMIIKQTKNDKINAFDFKCDLFNGGKLEKILSLFKIREIYLCLYSLSRNMSKLKNIYGKNINGKSYNMCFGTDADQEDIVAQLKSVEVAEFLKKFDGYSFSEAVIWSCYTDWNNFLSDLKNYSRKAQSSYKEDTPSFYLDYNHSDGKSIQIICDLSFNNGEKITKDDLFNILDNDFSIA